MILENLIPQIQHNCFAYLRMLRHLLPTGPIWQVPICKELEDCAPGWVNESTFIEDNFDTGLNNTYWDSDFLDNWTLHEYPVGSGNMAMVAGQGIESDLTDQLVQPDGNFNLSGEFILGGTDTGNRSVHIKIYDSTGGTELVDIAWFNNLILWTIGGSTQQSLACPFEPFKVVPWKITRQGSTITGWHWDDTKWVSFSLTGIYTGSIIVTLDGATTHGVNSLNFQAVSGFPNTSSSQPANIVECSKFSILLWCFARELGRLEEHVTNFIRETIPGLSTQLLYRWEEEAGLPDNCSPLASTVFQRQVNVHKKITAEYAQNIQFYVDYAASFGSTITIIEEPAEVTVTGVDSSDPEVGECNETVLSTTGTRHVWTVQIAAGDPNTDLLECIFNQIKQAHTRVVFELI